MYKRLYNHYRISSFKKTAIVLYKQLEEEPSNPQLLAEMAWVKFNLFKDEEALEYINRAEQTLPTMPLFWYVKGIILRSQEFFEESIDYWNKILRESIGALTVAVGGRQYALSMQNDARFYKATCFYGIGRDREALGLVREHIANRRRGLESDFTVKEARDFLRVLEFNATYSNKQSPSHDKEKLIPTNGSAGYMTYSQGKRVEAYLHKLKTQKGWNTIVAYLKRKCREFPKEYWLKTSLAEYLYLQNDRSCLRYAEAAYQMAGEDMLVVYNYACALYLNGRYADAFQQLQIIKDRGLDYIAYSEHGEGLRWAKKLLTDTETLSSSLLVRIKLSGNSSSIGNQNHEGSGDQFI